MRSIDVSGDSATEITEPATIDMRLEVVNLPVADVERAKRFYQRLGWRLHGDFAVGDDFRVAQLTPPQSPTSVTFGKGATTAEPGPVQDLMLIVDDIDVARNDLINRGVDVSDVYHYEGRPCRQSGGTFSGRVTRWTAH
jgi:catechol 2,3-dioxygenase-like lactoylglutathione lyase family enzyme